MAKFRPRIPSVNIHLAIAMFLLIAIGFFGFSGCDNGSTIDLEGATRTAEQEQQQTSPDTPEATHTLTATVTPSPTEMSSPTATATLTSTPTLTPTLVPTSTPAPTSTPTPTFTPAPTETLTPDPTVSYLLPDLQVLPPSVLYIEVDSATGVRELRFDTTVINMGEGPLILQGVPDEEGDRTLVVQHLDREDGGRDQVEVGHFVYHPGHEHWHFESFSEMQMYSLSEDQSLGEMLATSEKITSCVLDMNRLPSPPPNSPSDPFFSECGQEFQGLSVGWADTYAATLDGQELDITDIPDGRYALQLLVNPDELFIESNYDNNSAIVLVEIDGTTVIRISD